MVTWKMKISPARYLSCHPHGPNSDLARRILDERLSAYREVLDGVSALITRAIDVLARLLGCDLHCEAKEEGEDSVPAVCRSLLFHWHPREDLFSYGWEEFSRAENKLCGKMVKRFGVRIELYGTLGPPLDVWKLPTYWKHKSHPADYLWRRTGSGKRETLNLARAALAPIEGAIEKELVTIANALRSKLPSSSDLADQVHYWAMDHAQKQITYVRYDGKQSIEHWNAVEYWVNNLDLETPAETAQIRLAQERGLRLPAEER